MYYGIPVSDIELYHESNRLAGILFSQTLPADDNEEQEDITNNTNLQSQ